VTEQEFKNLIFQMEHQAGRTRKMPNVFTEPGAARLSNVLNSDRAIEVNIRIHQNIAKFWEMLLTRKDILLKLEQFEKQVVQNSEDIG